MHPFSYLGVPAANMGCNGSRACRQPPASIEKWGGISELLRKHVPDSDLGLVPRQGRGAWHRRHLTLPSTNAPIFIPWCAGTSHVGLACPPPGAGCVTSGPPKPMHPIIPVCRPSQKNVGPVPRQGRRGGTDEPDPPINQCTKPASNDQPPCTYLGVPATARLEREPKRLATGKNRPFHKKRKF